MSAEGDARICLGSNVRFRTLATKSGQSGYDPIADIGRLGFIAEMVDAIRPWFHLAWGAYFLLLLALPQRSWIRNPLRRTDDPGRFWLLFAFGILLMAEGSYEAWAQVQGR